MLWKKTGRKIGAQIRKLEWKLSHKLEAVAMGLIFGGEGPNTV